MPRFDPGRFLRDLDHHVNYLAVPTIMQRVRWSTAPPDRYDLSSLYAACGTWQHQSSPNIKGSLPIELGRRRRWELVRRHRTLDTSIGGTEWIGHRGSGSRGRRGDVVPTTDGSPATTRRVVGENLHAPSRATPPPTATSAAPAKSKALGLGLPGRSGLFDEDG